MRVDVHFIAVEPFFKEKTKYCCGSGLFFCLHYLGCEVPSGLYTARETRRLQLHVSTEQFTTYISQDVTKLTGS